jgi:hypothetical protein
MQRTASVRFNDKTVTYAVERLADYAGLKVEYTPDAKRLASRRVSLQLNGVTMEEALRRVLSPNGLGFEKTADGIKIVKP